MAFEGKLMFTFKLLWEEYNNSSSHFSISLQNCMRRILEFYFVYIGKDNSIKDFFNKLPIGPDKAIYQSLLLFCHVGSHEK